MQIAFMRVGRETMNKKSLARDFRLFRLIIAKTIADRCGSHVNS